MKYKYQVFLLTMFLFNSCFSMCENEILNTINSPNNEYKIVLFNRSCGATTDYSLQVSVLKKSERFKNREGNLFIAKSVKTISIKWVNDHLIEIENAYDNKEIFKQEENIYNIKVKYF